MNPPDAQDLADYMGLPMADQRHELCIQAAVQWVEDRRCATDPVELWTNANVNLGCLQYGAQLYQAKSASSGAPEYDELAMITANSAMASVHRLVGGPDPVFA